MSQKPPPFNAPHADAASKQSQAGERLSRRCSYSDLFDRLLDATVLVDLENYRVMDCNEAAERVLDLERGQLIGKALFEFLDPESIETAEKALRVAKRRYYPRQFEAKLLKSLETEISACVLKLGKDADTGEDIYVLQMVIKDVTIMKEAQRQAKQFLERLQEVNQKLEELSVTDELTQLFNVRHFKKELAKELERSTRYGSVFSIVFGDVDFFKKLNDTHGHAAGDAVLKQVAAVVKSSSRNTDLPARYGGEEFVVLCPGVSWEGAQVLAERIRTSVERHKFILPSIDATASVTISLGVASFPAHGKTMEALLKLADDALYLSKSRGRNRVTCAEEVVVFRKAAA